MMTKYSAFSEGWGLYAESPLIAEYTDAYKNQPLSRYGMLKGQVCENVNIGAQEFFDVIFDAIFKFDDIETVMIFLACQIITMPAFFHFFTSQLLLAIIFHQLT